MGRCPLKLSEQHLAKILFNFSLSASLPMPVLYLRSLQARGCNSIRGRCLLVPETWEQPWQVVINIVITTTALSSRKADCSGPPTCSVFYFFTPGHAKSIPFFKPCPLIHIVIFLSLFHSTQEQHPQELPATQPTQENDLVRPQSPTTEALP